MKNKNIYAYIISFILLILIVVKGCELLDNNKLQRSTKELSEDIKLKGEGDIVFGNPDALLPVYLFGNYRCKFCIKTFKEVLPILLEEYKGRIKIVFKPVPFSNTKEEMDALIMAISVSNYGDYKPFHDLLLKDSDVIFDPNYKEYLMEIMKLNSAIANSFLDDKTRTYIDDNKKTFGDLKIKGTPTFIIGKKVISGYCNYDEIKNIIDNRLKNML